MRTVVPAADLDPRESPSISNFLLLYGELRRRHGYKKFGTTLPLGNPPVMQLAPFTKQDGSKRFVALTTRKIYDWTGSDWTQVTQTDGDFTGTDLDKFDFCTMLDTLIYTNGVDTARKWTGSGNAVTVLAAMKARYCESWLSRVFYGYITDAGGTFSNRIKWTASGSLTDFTGLGSGAADLMDTPGEIQRMRKISSGEMAIYKPDYIDIAVPTGIARDPIVVVGGRSELVGLAAPFSLADLGGRHIGLGKGGLFMFDGNTARPIAEAVRNSMFPAMNAERLRTAHAIARPELNLYYLWAPSSGSKEPDDLWIVNYVDDTVIKCLMPAYSSGIYITGTPPTINSLVGTIDDQTFRFDDLNAVAAAPLYVIGLKNGNTEQIDEASLDDDGSVRSAEWQSKDFTNPAKGRMLVLTKLAVDVRASTAAALICEASINKGGTWTPSTPATESTTADDKYTKMYFYFLGVVGEYVRFRLRADTKTNITIRGYKAEFLDGGQILDV